MLISLEVVYTGSAEEELSTAKNTLQFLMEANDSGTQWTSSLTVELGLLMKKCSLHKRSDLESLIMHRGFTSTQKKQLIRYFKKSICIEQAQLKLTRDTASAKLLSTRKMRITWSEVQRYTESSRLESALIFDIYEALCADRQHKRGRKRGAVYFHERTSVNSQPASSHNFGSPEKGYTTVDLDKHGGILDDHISILTPADFEYGDYQYMANEVEKDNTMDWLTYYNELRCTYNRRYYLTIKQRDQGYLVRLQFMGKGASEEIWVSMYQTFHQKMCSAVIKDKRTQVITQQITSHSSSSRRRSS